jgi:hypothetical protein
MTWAFEKTYVPPVRTTLVLFPTATGTSGGYSWQPPAGLFGTNFGTFLFIQTNNLTLSGSGTPQVNTNYTWAGTRYTNNLFPAIWLTNIGGIFNYWYVYSNATLLYGSTTPLPGTFVAAGSTPTPAPIATFSAITLPNAFVITNFTFSGANGATGSVSVANNTANITIGNNTNVVLTGGTYVFSNAQVIAYDISYIPLTNAPSFASLGISTNLIFYWSSNNVPPTVYGSYYDALTNLQFATISGLGYGGILTSNGLGTNTTLGYFAPSPFLGVSITLTNAATSAINTTYVQDTAWELSPGYDPAMTNFPFFKFPRPTIVNYSVWTNAASLSLGGQFIFAYGYNSQFITYYAVKNSYTNATTPLDFASNTNYAYYSISSTNYGYGGTSYPQTNILWATNNTALTPPYASVVVTGTNYVFTTSINQGKLQFQPIIAQFPITNVTSYVYNHGLGFTPTFVNWSIVCVSTDSATLYGPGNTVDTEYLESAGLLTRSKNTNSATLSLNTDWITNPPYIQTTGGGNIHSGNNITPSDWMIQVQIVP